MVQLLWIIGRLILDPIIGIASLPLSVRANDDDGFIGVNHNLPHTVETYLVIIIAFPGPITRTYKRTHTYA